MNQNAKRHLDEHWRALQESHDEGARQALVEAHVGLVRYVAGRLALGLPHYLEFPDLYGAGLLGLIQSIDNFDTSRGIKFETYAIPRIRGAILDELRSQDWFPRSLRRKAREVEDAYARLESTLGRPASDEEVAGELELSLEEFDRVMTQVSAATIVSLETELHPDEGGSVHRIIDTIADLQTAAPGDRLADEEMRDVIVGCLDELSERERLVLTLYYYEELTLREIGEVLNVTESRVCQVHTKAIFRLRGKLERKLSDRPLERLSAEVVDAMSGREKVGAL
jgi:RNA polymerase sigma factor for flagellar operon FliA